MKTVVRNVVPMLAGAHGIDVVLFTVAADDGVMPQTVEHLDIVHLLRVPQAIFVITKCDLVPASRYRLLKQRFDAWWPARTSSAHRSFRVPR